MEIRTLRYFLAVAREGSITRAANFLHLTQPTLSRQMQDLEEELGLPLLCSRQVITPHPGENAFVDWFGADFGKLDIAVNYNLVFNAAILVEAGVGYAITLDGLADTSPESALCFRPLEPRLESGLDIIWKKYQVFSPAAELFLSRLRALVGQ